VTGNQPVTLHTIAGFDAKRYAPTSMYWVAQEVTGAGEYWNNGITGKGVDVALLDSGVAEVNGLRGAKVVHGPDLSYETDDPALRNRDTFGHGTHMAGIIAGRDDGTPAVVQKGDEDHFLGMAPGARLVSLKLADASGATDVSQMIAGIDWVVQNRNRNGLNIRVLNLSFGTDGVQSYLLDPLTYAVEVAWRKGIVVVVSAGNDGDGSAKLNNPAYDPPSWPSAGPTGAAPTTTRTTPSRAGPAGATAPATPTWSPPAPPS
jgi:serine protease AprX